MEDTSHLLDDLDIDLPIGPGPAGDAGAPEDDHQGAQFFGTFQLIQQIGAGGVALVYRARHIHPGYASKNFAIKVLNGEVSADPTVVDLFRGEAFVLSLLKHPNIVETFEAGAQEEKLYIAMEYIDGRNLDNLVIRCQKLKIPLPIHVAMHIIGESLKALAYAHELCDADDNPLNLVHRDVNPSNVFLSYDGRVKLGDFGVASIAAGRVEKERELAGKVGYFAPEQLAGDEIDQRADLFSMGVMAFELLCGVRLFEADNFDKAMSLNKKAKVPRPTKYNKAIPRKLEDAMLCALSRKPSERFSSGREMLQAFAPFIPPPTGMPLAVAALMRKAFLNEHIQELQMNEGLAGGKVTRGSGQLITVVSRDQRAQAAFNELLLSRGYRVELCDTCESLGDSVSTSPPNVILMDVGTEGFRAEKAISQLARCPTEVAVVAVAEALEPQWITAAEKVGAVDLLFKPFNIERVLTSVRAAISGAVRIAQVASTRRVTTELVAPKILMLSRDEELIEELTMRLGERGYLLNVVEGTEAALTAILDHSYHAIIYDAHPATPADRFFAAQVRSQPGMGLVPILYLANRESHSLFAGVDADRGAVRTRDDPAAVLLETLKRLRGDTRLGRTFIRYPASFPIDVRWGGRVFAASAVDISRGGLMLRCGAQMPPVGTPVGLTLKIPTSSTALQAKGRVARVDLNQGIGSERGAMVGVEFESFAGAGERTLIAYLATLDHSGREKPTTVIIGAPPPAAPQQ